MQIQLAKLKAENERLKREVNDLRSNKYPSEMPQKVESVQVEPTLEAPVEKLIAKPVTKKKQPVITSQPVPAKSEKPATVAKKDDSIPPPPPPPEDEPPFEEEFYRVGTSSHGILDRIDSNKALLYEATRSSGKKVAKISILEGKHCIQLPKRCGRKAEDRIPYTLLPCNFILKNFALF